jgi:hypothetical protein
MRRALVIFLLSFSVAAHADAGKESYTPRVDKLELALRTHSRHALETLPNSVLAELRAGHTFTLAKIDEREIEERGYTIVIGGEREEISGAAYEALRSDFAVRQR